MLLLLGALSVYKIGLDDIDYSSSSSSVSTDNVLKHGLIALRHQAISTTGSSKQPLVESNPYIKEALSYWTEAIDSATGTSNTQVVYPT